MEFVKQFILLLSNLLILSVLLFNFYQHQQLSCDIQLFSNCKISFFVNVNRLISYKVQFFISCSILPFVSINSFISYNIQYQIFMVILDHFTKSISNAEDLLDYIVSSRLSRHLYLCIVSQIFNYTIQISFQTIKRKFEII